MNKSLTVYYSGTHGGVGYAARSEIKVSALSRQYAFLSGVNGGSAMSGKKIFDIIGRRETYKLTFSPLSNASNETFIERLEAGEVSGISLYNKFPPSIVIFGVADSKITISEATFGGVVALKNKWRPRTLTITPAAPQAALNNNEVDYDGDVYNDSEIFEASQDRETSLDKSRLGLDTSTVELKSAVRIDSGYRLFSALDISRNGAADGRYYLTDVKRTAAERYKLMGVSSVGRLQNVTHLGGIYNGETAQSVIEDICGDIPVTVDADYASVPLYGYLPATSDARDNLAQVLFAIGASLKTEADGTLHVTTLSTAISGTFGEDDVYAGATVETDAAITDVIVYEHTYKPGTAELILFDGTAEAGQLVIFDEPAHSLTATGFSILASGSNWARLSSGTGELIGYNYEHSTRAVRGEIVPNAPLKNEKTVSAATLVSANNVNQVVSRLMTYYGCREHIVFSAVTTDETSGDVLSVIHPFDGSNVVGTVEKVSITASATRKGSFRLLSGFIPPEAPESFDNEAILTGSGSWTVPAGVTRLRLVLIGGGKGGSLGENGADAENPTVTVDTANRTKGVKINELRELTAQGGKGGKGGLGGKVYDAIINVTPGDTFSYLCGVGGAGQTALLPAEDGTATTLGTHSSDDGASYGTPIYTLYGIAYGGNGDDGINGGNGGGYRVGSDLPVVAPDIVVEGVTYTAGAQGADYDTNYEYSGHEYGVRSSGSLGGGNAYKANGNPGAQSSDVWVTSPPSALHLTLNVEAGGNGADAVAPNAETTLGKGGKGGHGGGGGGQIGFPNYAFTDFTAHVSRLTVNLPAIPAKGGSGSSGSKGGDGVIIIQY